MLSEGVVIFTSSYSALKAKPTRDRSMSAVVSRAQANKDKPKNRFEAEKD